MLEWGKDKPVIGRFFTFCLEKGEEAQGTSGKGAGDCFCFLLFVGIHPRVQAPGPELWLPAFWIWISSPAFLQLCWGVLLAGIMGATECKAVWSAVRGVQLTVNPHFDAKESI